MQQISQALLKKLHPKKPKSPMVTLYMPTNLAAAPPNLSEDRIRYKNLVSRAKKILGNKTELDTATRERVEAKLEAYLENMEFWEKQARGLLVCVSPTQSIAVSLPLPADEYLAVDTHYHLAPVYALVQQMADFYLLHVARSNPRLYKGNAYQLVDSGIDLPQSPKEALGIDETYQRSVQQFRIASGAGARFHGHGDVRDAERSDAQRFYAILDELLCKAGDTSLPLLLSGTSKEVADYRRVTKYPTVLKQELEGNHADATTAELHTLSWPLVYESLVLETRQTALAELNNQLGLGDGQASTAAAAIMDAAEKGRIDTLFVGLLVPAATTSDVPRLGFTDNSQTNKLVDYVALHTWRNSGRVLYTYNHELDSSIAALFRY